MSGVRWFAQARRLPGQHTMASCRYRTLPDGTTQIADIDPPGTDPSLFGHFPFQVVSLPDFARSVANETPTKRRSRKTRSEWYLPPYWELR